MSTDYVCPQCGPAPEGAVEHAKRAHTWFYAEDYGKEIVRYADEAMYTAVPIAEKDKPVEPRVTLIHMTPDPLRVMAAASEQYRGIPVHSPKEISRETALEWLESMSMTRLQAPLEFIDLHFYFEGVTRAFTHQLVRQRTAVYVQESMRFAVKENAAYEVQMPPSISYLKEDDPRRVLWDKSVTAVTNDYKNLINAGIPAEDARGLLPTNITTRVHYKTNLRNLAEQAGNRLCSQAQYEWKIVWAKMIQAILDYGEGGVEWRIFRNQRWQREAIVQLFKPVCYQTGKCEFMAPTDRWCVIRDRVQAHYGKGEKPPWPDINPHECLMPDAARRSHSDER